MKQNNLNFCMCLNPKKFILGILRLLTNKIYKTFLLILIIFNTQCGTKKNSFYIKARNNEEVKIGAFEICGRDFKILAFEEDTALIICTKK